MPDDEYFVSSEMFMLEKGALYSVFYKSKYTYTIRVVQNTTTLYCYYTTYYCTVSVKQQVGVCVVHRTVRKKKCKYNSSNTCIMYHTWYMILSTEYCKYCSRNLYRR